MLYPLLRAMARTALGWYYADIAVQGREHIPERGPLLVISNHPNALVDALLVGTTLERRVRLTAKATLFENPVLAPVLDAAGVVPLRRAQDERSAARGRTAADVNHDSDASLAAEPRASRNEDAFRRVTEALALERAVLVFPEGISHDQPALAPLKTGAARMALAAEAAGVRNLRVLPLGLVFEEKERPRSSVLVRAGEPLDIDAWLASNGADAAALTRELDARLRDVTLNFASAERARRAVRLSRALVAVTSGPRPIASGRPLADEADASRRIERVTDALSAADATLHARADRFVEDVTALENRLRLHGVSIEDVRISPALRPGAWFVLREGLVLLASAPVALLGRVAHWLPIRLARALAMRSLRSDPSRDQPAMRTIVLGLGMVLLWYLLQALVLWRWIGGAAALLWLVAIFIAAQVDFSITDRVERARRRARTYLVFRRDPAFREGVLADADRLATDAAQLERDTLAGLSRR